jgi:fido (protein-threonine AMPylation protein)
MADSTETSVRSAAGKRNDLQMSLLADSNSLERQMRQRRLEIRNSPVEPTFDSAHLTAIHDRLLSGYSLMPGDRRVTNVAADGKRLSGSAPRPADILSREHDAFERLRAEGMLQGRTREDFARGITSHLNELRVIGSFRSETEHVLAPYAEQLAEQAGYRLDMERVPSKLLRPTAQRGSPEVLVGRLRNQVRAHAVPESAIAFKDAQISGNRDAAIDVHPQLAGAFAQADRAKSEMLKADDPRAAWKEYERTMRGIQRQLEDGKTVAAPDPRVNGRDHSRGISMTM